MSGAYHIPVLLQPTADLLVHRPDGWYVDCTFGGGGHSGAILDRLGPQGRLIGLDQDPDAAANAPQDSRFQLIKTNFGDIAQAVQAAGTPPLAGILADLGISSHQIDAAERGFSYRYDAPLDMRMDTADDSTPTAADIVNTWTEHELATLLRTYGELPGAGRMARLMVQARPIYTTAQLTEALRPALPRKDYPVLSQVYQALRIAVNQEMEVLESLLRQALDLLDTGGRLVIIAYHSLEDRMVKHWLATGNLEGQLHKDFYGNPLTPWRLITRKAVVPTEEEIAENPRARSARLRAAEKLAPATQSANDKP